MRVLTRVLSFELLLLGVVAGAAACGNKSATSSADGQGEGGLDAGLGDAALGDASPDAQGSEAGAIVAVPLVSCALGPGQVMYVAPATIGSQEGFMLEVDTSSTTLAVASKGCSSCTGIAPLYDPGSGAVDQKKKVMAQYSSGIGWTGEVYQDGVAMGMAPAVPVKVVAIETQSQFFAPVTCSSGKNAYQGILGLAPSNYAVPGTNGFFDMFVASDHSADVFAHELCDRGGTLWLGGYDETKTTAPPQYVPMSADPTHRYAYPVDLTSISIQGTSVPIASAAYPVSLLDTGTSAFILPSAAFNTLTSAIAASAGFAQIFNTDASWFSSADPCMTLSQTKAELDAALPPITLVFAENPAVSVQALPTESYLVPEQGGWCSGLYALDPSPGLPVSSILGAPILRSNVVIYDRANRRVGWAPHAACP